MIPDNEAYNDFLRDCCVTAEPTGSHVPLSAFPRRNLPTEALPALYLQFPTINLSLESVVQKFRNSLAAADHIEDDRVAVVAIALSVATCPVGKSPVQHTNEFLNKTHCARLMQSIILPAQLSSGYVANLGTYAVRTFDPAKILYWANRCGSSYPIDLIRFRGWGALEREPYELHILDCQAADWRPEWRGASNARSLLDDYYYACAHAYSNQVMRNVKRDILVLEAGAMTWIDDDLINTMFQKTVSLFTWNKSGKYSGWACYSSMEAINSNLPPVGLVERCRSWLTHSLGFNGLSEAKPFDQTIKAYCRFMQRANRHRLAGRSDEAYLHFVIALDLLFSASAGSSSETVASCAGLLTYRQLNVSFDKNRKHVKSLYDRRSRYVHRGESILPTALGDVERLCTEVLWTLLSASGTNIVEDQEEWMKRLRMIISLLDANRDVDENEFSSVGIPSVGAIRNSPNHVEYGGGLPMGDVLFRNRAQPGGQDGGCA